MSRQGILEQIYLPGMLPKWFWQDHGTVGINFCRNIFTVGDRFNWLFLFDREEPLVNYIRAGYCEALHTAARVWAEENPDTIVPLAFQALVQRCVAEPQALVVPWSVYKAALDCGYMTYPSWTRAAKAALDADEDDRWIVDVRHEIYGDEVSTRIGGGWADLDGFSVTYLWPDNGDISPYYPEYL